MAFSILERLAGNRSDYLARVQHRRENVHFPEPVLHRIPIQDSIAVSAGRVLRLKWLKGGMQTGENGFTIRTSRLADCNSWMLPGNFIGANLQVLHRGQFSHRDISRSLARIAISANL